jgi:hypothetical protein
MTYPGGIGGSGQGMITTQTDKERRDEADRILKILDREGYVRVSDCEVLADSTLSNGQREFLSNMLAGGVVTPKQLFYLRDLKDKLLS